MSDVFAPADSLQYFEKIIAVILWDKHRNWLPDHFVSRVPI
jgi:hypothetical protein